MCVCVCVCVCVLTLPSLSAVFVLNRADREDFTVESFRAMQDVIVKFFEDSKLRFTGTRLFLRVLGSQAFWPFPVSSVLRYPCLFSGFCIHRHPRLS